jgi:hypothetical protein
MIYARAHDQTVAEDYFTAMQRVEQRLEILPKPEQKTKSEALNGQGHKQVSEMIDLLALPELCFEQRLDVLAELRELLGTVYEHAPPQSDKTNWRFKVHRYPSKSISEMWPWAFVLRSCHPPDISRVHP